MIVGVGGGRGCNKRAQEESLQEKKVNDIVTHEELIFELDELGYGEGLGLITSGKEMVGLINFKDTLNCIFRADFYCKNLQALMNRPYKFELESLKKMSC